MLFLMAKKEYKAFNFLFLLLFLEFQIGNAVWPQTTFRWFDGLGNHMKSEKGNSK